MSTNEALNQGTVTAVGFVPYGQSISQECGKIQCVAGEGIRGDRHGGTTRLVDVRERRLISCGIPKGVPIANFRQFSAVSAEEVALITAAYACSGELPLELNWTHFGANLMVDGIPAFSQLPLGTLLSIADPKGSTRTTCLWVAGINTPCATPGEAIVAANPSQTITPAEFSRHAKNRRGIVGLVYCSGIIKVGDRVTVIPPSGSS